MEMTRVPEAGYEIIGLWISGLQRSLKFSNLILPVKLVMSYFKAKSIIRKFRPHAVVGTGGYASGPILLAASRMHIPCLIQEQNSYAGLANKQVAEKVSRICVAYEGMDKYFPKEKIVFTGNPVRKDILSVDAKREQSLVHFGFDASIRTLLIVGGSLGARTINESMLAGFDKLMDARIQVIWQTGKTYYASVKSRLGGYDLRRIRVYDFLKEVDLAYAAADVVISRAGAIAVSELCLAGKAVILVPSPNVAEDHQTKNALALVKHEAAVLVTDADAPEKMVNEALKLLFDEVRAKKLSDNIRQLAKPQATDDIVMELEKLMDAKNTGPATVSGKVTAMMLN